MIDNKSNFNQIHKFENFVYHINLKGIILLENYEFYDLK